MRESVRTQNPFPIRRIYIEPPLLLRNPRKKTKKNADKKIPAGLKWEIVFVGCLSGKLFVRIRPELPYARAFILFTAKPSFSMSVANANGIRSVSSNLFGRGLELFISSGAVKSEALKLARVRNSGCLSCDSSWSDGFVVSDGSAGNVKSILVV